MKRSTLVVATLVVSLAMTGCGSSTVTVKGVLKIDGQPVDGATVTFMSEDGKKSFSGMSDSEGNFALSGPDKIGALPGNYKVLVVKGKKVAGLENMSPEGADYKKQMEKMGKESAKPKTGPGGPTRPGSGEDGSAVKSDLPSIYASVTTTPLTAKVPPDSQPVQIDLKSKP